MRIGYFYQERSPCLFVEKRAQACPPPVHQGVQYPVGNLRGECTLQADMPVEDTGAGITHRAVCVVFRRRKEGRADAAVEISMPVGINAVVIVIIAATAHAGMLVVVEKDMVERTALIAGVHIFRHHFLQPGETEQIQPYAPQTVCPVVERKTGGIVGQMLIIGLNLPIRILPFVTYLHVIRYMVST
ncbi:hypothetical protein Barb7_02818 [Bacteroidales bacterium Barb7]|nr:hypothetical protein Barb7_02818 [Bacteroidales bacterium Barb7]